MSLISFETERLILRPVVLTDATFILKLFNSPKWLTYIGDRNVHAIPDAENYIKEKMFPQYDLLGYGNYMVLRKEDEVPLGNCGLYDRPGLEGVDIGFAFLEAYEKKGYAYEAAQCLVTAAFNDFSISKIGAITLEENSASRRLLEKLGLAFSKYVMINEEQLMYYEITKSVTS